MKIVILDTYEQMCNLASDVICKIVSEEKRPVLGLATGSTALGVYDAMVAQYEKGLSFASVSTVNLDEYAGLDASHPQSYAYYMDKQLFSRIDVNKANTHLPCGVAKDLTKECARYDKLLSKLPRDVQLLGLGSDGHVAFNEPGSPFDCRTRVVELTEQTIRDNSRLFDKLEDVPRFAISMGIADIMAAKKIVLLANGSNKAQAVAAMVNGEISESCPASVLRRHSDATIILDKAAASLLN